MTTLGSERLQLVVELSKLSQALWALRSNDRLALDQYQRTALGHLLSHLREMAEECRSGKLRPRDKRYGNIARIVVEMDPSVIPPELGGQLIEAERKYQAL